MSGGETPVVGITHVVCGPYVPGEQEHADQRYFTRANTNLDVETDLCYGAKSKVYRLAGKDSVGVSLEVVCYENNVRVSASEVLVQMTAHDLRHLALRLLDAAYDLDTYPSTVLVGENERAGAFKAEAAS